MGKMMNTLITVISLSCIVYYVYPGFRIKNNGIE